MTLWLTAAENWLLVEDNDHIDFDEAFSEDGRPQVRCTVPPDTGFHVDVDGFKKEFRNEEPDVRIETDGSTRSEIRETEYQGEQLLHVSDSETEIIFETNEAGIAGVFTFAGQDV